VPLLAELVDAVVGVDTHRDTHQVEIAHPNGALIALTTISNDATGYAELLAWIVDHTPGPRLVVSIEGTRGYGVGLARAAATAGLIVLECEQPHRKIRRGKGKSDPIDAHLAVLAALRLNADRLPTPRADGDNPGTGASCCPAVSARWRSSPTRKSSPASCAAAIPTNSCPPVWPRRRCLIGPIAASNRPIRSKRSISSVTATMPATGVNDRSGAPIRTRRRLRRRPRKLPTR
jgi:hypothetical protein